MNQSNFASWPGANHLISRRIARCVRLRTGCFAGQLPKSAKNYPASVTLSNYSASPTIALAPGKNRAFGIR